MIKVGMVSLGCSKNQVDAERMLAQLNDNDMVIENDPYACDAVIINTCGFIESAKAESIENILEFAELKESGQIKVIAVTGCLAERYREEIASEIPEADVILGIGSNSSIVSAIKRALDGEKVIEFSDKDNLSLEGRRILANDSYFAYLKVAEGCDNNCTYCAIPAIRGRFRSRKIENIVAEAKELAEAGVKELNVVAQDSTRYGEDLYGKLMLPELLSELAKIDKIHWVRVLYCYPERITDELIEVIKNNDKIVNYFDIPLQHAADPVLKRMNRKTTADKNREIINKIRTQIPDAIIRTTFIAGFPGETEEQFEELCEFIDEVKFERLGCFAYSIEDGTPAEKLDGQLDEDTKQRRAEVVMEVQLKNVVAFSESMVGKTLEVLIEGYPTVDKDDNPRPSYFGRSYMDAPDVDSRVYFESDKEHKIGDFATVKITDYMDYDLVGIED